MLLVTNINKDTIGQILFRDMILWCTYIEIFHRFYRLSLEVNVNGLKTYLGNTDTMFLTKGK